MMPEKRSPRSNKNALNLGGRERSCLFFKVVTLQLQAQAFGPLFFLGFVVAGHCVYDPGAVEQH